MTKFLKRWLPVVLWMFVIFYFSSLPIIRASQVDVMDFIIKKGAHVFEYAVLFVLLSRALSNQAQFQTAFLLGFLYAFTDEIHQLFIPGRTGRLRDVLLFDTLGLLISWRLLLKNPKLLVWIEK